MALKGNNYMLVKAFPTRIETGPWKHIQDNVECQKNYFYD